MSDTPRADLMEQHAPVGLRRNSAFEQASDLCRQLERELIAAQERIKRLEEAGDRMFRMLEHDGCESVGQNMWKQAKEAKP